MLTFEDIFGQDTALEWLRRNVERCRARCFGATIEVFEGSWNDWKDAGFDILLSNPPYLTRDEHSQAERSVKDFEPPTALVHDGGRSGSEDGHDSYREIFAVARRALVPEGWLYMELGIAQGTWIAEHAAALEEWNDLQVIKDIAKKPRFFCARKG